MKKIIVLIAVVVIAGAFFLFPHNKYVSALKTKVINLQSKYLNSSQDRRGQVEYVEGQVEKRNGENDGWRVVQQGEILKKGMELRTLAQSRAVVTFEDGSVARLNENSQLKMDSGDDFLRLDLFAGAVYSRVAADDSRKYIVVVDDFEIVALGTAFGVEKSEDSLMEVQVVESKVEITKGQENSLGFVSEGSKAEFTSQSVEIKTAQITEQDKQEEFFAWNASNDEKYFKEKAAKEEGKEIVEKKAEEKVVKNEEAKKVETDEKIENKEISKDGYATSISLKGEGDGEKVRFSWTVLGGKAPKGFKIVKSKQPNPVFPGDDYLYISDPDDRSAVWKGFKKEKTYFFRICIYKGGECGAYSNNVEIDFD